MTKNVLMWLLIIVIVGVALSFRDRSLVAGIAPVITAQVFNQNEILTINTKRPSLVYFWASWCGICRSIQNTMQTILQQHPGVTVAMKSGDEQLVRRYLDANLLTWPFVVDEYGQISNEYGVLGVPTIFILDSQGKIRFTSVGYVSIWGLKLRLWLAGFE